MKKFLWKLAAMVGMASMGMNYDIPIVVKHEPKLRNCDQKKCKSCKNYNKLADMHHRCTIKGYTKPMYNACINYKKRRK